MAVCLRKISGLSMVKVVDAVWIWTEPHSLRLKIKLTIQKEVTNGAILQQAVVVDFVIRNKQCKNCEAAYAQGAWHAVVQVRQRVEHKRTFLFLEQLLLKHNAHHECIRIVTFKDGMDFYFAEKNVALRFIDFLEGQIPVKVKYARKLVTADHKANVGNFKHNHLVEICPVCKDDLVILPIQLAQNISNISRLVLVKRVSAGLHIIDPFTGERGEINCEKYWRAGFTSALNTRMLIRFVVLSVEPVITEVRASAKIRGRGSKKIRLAECVVAREKDLGANDTQFTCMTHLGNLLQEGDTVLGYDLSTASMNIDESVVGSMKGFDRNTPDLVLVRKDYGSKGNRKWALRNLEVDEEAELNRKDHEEREADYEAFMQELETDKELRANINLYKNIKNLKTRTQRSKKKGTMEVDDGGDEDDGAEDEDGVGDDEDDEEVRLDELLEGMELDGGDDGDGKEAFVLEGVGSVSGTAQPKSTAPAGVFKFDVGSNNKFT